MALLIFPPKARLRKARTGNGDEILRKLESFLKDGTEKLVKILCRFWADQAAVITYRELREAVLAGRMDEEIFRQWSDDYSVLVQEKLQDVWKEAMLAGSISQALTADLDSYSFNVNLPSVTSWISERSGTFIRNSMIEQREAIQCLLEKAVVEKHSVDELSRYIRPCIGLTKQQSRAGMRYYDNMVDSLKEAHPRMKESSIRQKALDASSKYAERLHRQRAMTIAQTEMASAYNFGADDGIRQAQEQGLIGKTVKRWCTSGDDHVCSMCQALEGMEIDMDEEWKFGRGWNGTGSGLFPPAHPRCACAVEYIEVGKSPDSELTEDEKYAINRYLSSESYVLNEELRNGEAMSADHRKWVSCLDSALEKMPEYNGTVYRSVSDFGIDDVGRFISSHSIGQLLDFPSYLSTSEGIYDDTFPIQYVIMSKHGKDIRSFNKAEREILFTRNSSFWVSKIIGNTIYMTEA